MKSIEFAELYDPQMPADFRHVPGLEAVIEPAQQWSQRFGELLHEHLTSGVHADDAFPLLIAYRDWTNYQLPTIIQVCRLQEDDELRRQMATELQFHILNQCMLPMWGSLFDGPNQRPDRVKSIVGAQDLLALHAMEWYITREHLAGEKQRFIYFDESNQQKRAYQEGTANEFDAGLVLMEVAKKYGLQVVPGPRQFESSKKTPGLNADFVVVDQNMQAVGVQVKSKVRHEHVDQYDDDAIVLFDATHDMANVSGRRTDVKSSNVKTVSWAGMIAAHRVLKVETAGKAAIPLTQAQRQQILRIKMRVKGIIGKTPDYLAPSAKIIHERITHKLAETALTT